MAKSAACANVVKSPEWVRALNTGSEDMKFVPPYDLILKHFVTTPKGSQARNQVTVNREFLEFLLRGLLEHVEFDEMQYLKCNPDVADAVRKKEMQSAREHFLTTGYFEGRIGGVPVQEDWYLARNPDVAAAKRARKVESAEMQYRIAGANEWRQPNPRSLTGCGKTLERPCLSGVS
jgi:hypothetical protein